MPTIETPLLKPKSTGKRAAVALAILTLAGAGLTACGGSASKTASSANASATGTSTSAKSSTSVPGTSSSTSAPKPGAPAATGKSRFSSIRACLKKNGADISSYTEDAAGHRSSNVPTATLQAALRKCYAGAPRPFARPNPPPAASQATRNPVFRQALAKYAECLRQNGVNIPAPNTSGKGPIFDTKGLKMNSPQFQAATKKCRATLIGAFRHVSRPKGAGGSPQAGQAQGGSASG